MDVSHGSETRHRYAPAKGRLPEFVLGVCAAILGLYVSYDATTYSDGSAYDNLGPSLMPIIIAMGLVASGLAISKSTLGAEAEDTSLEPMDWKPVVLIGLAIAISIVCLTTFGWVPVIAVVFALGSRAFGSQRYVLDLLAGLAFSVTTFAIFNYGLGLSLPVGTLLTRVLGG